MEPVPLPPLLRAALEEPLRLVERAREAGRRAVGYTCSYVPEPLLSVKGLFPLRLRAPGIAGTPLADTYLSSVLCSYPRSLLEVALTGGFEHLDGWVLAASCDHVRRLGDNLDYLLRPSFLQVLDLPHRRGETALAWFVEELRSLARALSRSFGVDAGPAALRAAISRQNEYLEVMRAIGDLRRRDPPPLSGSTFHRILVATASAPKDLLLDELRELRATIENRVETRRGRARLMLLGSELDDPEYLRLIESVGGLVVADRFCFGSLPGLEPIAVDGDPIEALGRHAFENNCCPRMMEDFDRRLAYALQVADDYGVDGIVVETMKFCDLWGMEAISLVEALRAAGIPVLRLEREYARGGEGQLRTRIQAFLESLGR
jgi:benzoyl-CoA reductase/2-hydroxyglutaryl-CoA dehydratase subunit BcrC/BadD/HgdB